jgi:hypothetical protein
VAIFADQGGLSAVNCERRRGDQDQDRVRLLIMPRTRCWALIWATKTPLCDFGTGADRNSPSRKLNASGLGGLRDRGRGIAPDSADRVGGFGSG